MSRRGYGSLATAILSLLLAFDARADDSASVRSAVEGLYGALAAGDVNALAHFLPPGGFTEFSPPESTLKILDAEYFRRVLSAGARVDLTVENAQVRMLGSTAVLAGFRVGSITLPDGKRLDVHDCMTMLWSREQSAWLLRHVHISACPR